MGTDIHGYWEIRDHDNEWVAIKPINDNRNYLWFGIIAGVRNSIYWDNHNEPWDRGMPKDASHMCKYLMAGNWHHNATWLTLEEIKIANEVWKKESREYYSFTRDEPTYEPILTPESIISNLFISNKITLKWAGPIGDIISRDHPFEECIRMVCTFDS